MFIAKDIQYIGVNDHNIDLFEGQYKVPKGMSYNSYVILDDKIAVLDTVDKNFYKEWSENLKASLNGRKPNYLVVHHMEPDHSANILNFMNDYPECIIVSSKQSFVMMKNYFSNDFESRRIVIAEGDELNLGKHTLKFISAPMVHWPEVMLSYDLKDKILFSADAFGKFGALDSCEKDWECEARRYYFGIVGKFGAQVQALLKKAATLEIKTICPLHGPVLNENIEHYINIYDIWSSYAVESDGVFIAYTSVYGNTKEAVNILAEKLKEKGISKVTVTDLARDDMAEAVEDAFKYGKIVLATTTYNGEIFPFMKQFIDILKEHNYQNRIIGFIENGSWNPVAAKRMKTLLEECKNITFTQANVKILSTLKDKNLLEIEELASELSK